MYADFMFHYRVDLTDVVECRSAMTPRQVLLLAQRLPDDSMTSAMMAGGRQFFGWGTDRYMMADLYDAVNVNTTATGNWKKGKQPDIPPWPRPKKDAKDKKKNKKRVTVKDVFGRFQARKG